MEWRKIAALDDWLDREVGEEYQGEGQLAQHWARVAKIAEEGGEAIERLISWTGQNPRKPRSEKAYYSMLEELADVAMTATLAIQHFTKDTRSTEAEIRNRLDALYERAFPGSA